MQGVLRRETDIAVISLVNLLSQVMHELVRFFCQKFAPFGCFDEVWFSWLLLRLLLIFISDFGYVVHVHQAADLIVVKDVLNFDFQTPFLSVFSAIIWFVRVGTLNFTAAYSGAIWLFLVSDWHRFALNLV